MERAKNCSGQAAAEEANPGIAGKVGNHTAGECAGCHHALDADVDDTGHLREAGTQGGKQQRGGKQKGGVDDNAQFVNESVHFCSSSFASSIFFTGAAFFSFFNLPR